MAAARAVALALLAALALSQVPPAMAGCDIKVDPLYYPSPDYTPEIDLKGMVAVITGASRGVGLGAATELQKVGVTVIGTSRTPEDYSLPYELLPLEVTSQASVDAFVQRVLAHEAVVARGGIDILVSNAGRFILGNSLIRPGGKDIYYSGLNLSLSTIFLGNARVVNSLLPALEARHKAGGYARLAITVSPTASYTGGTEPYSLGFWAYIAIKRAYMTYANGLRTALAARGSGVVVGTVNPQSTHADLAAGCRPIFIQPTDASCNAPGDPLFQAFLSTLRPAVQYGIDNFWAGEGYVELLSRRQPPLNVAIGSWDKPQRLQGQNDLTLPPLKFEMLQSAFPISCDAAAPPGPESVDPKNECGALRVTPRTLPSPGYAPQIDLKGKVAVITGASRGIGAAVARALKAAGVTVIGTSRTPGNYSLPYELLPLDVASQASVDAFAAAVAGHKAVVARGGIDILVNNAGRDGLGSILPATALAPEFYTGLFGVLQTNYLGAVRVTNALMPLLDKRAFATGYGRLLFTSAPAGYTVTGPAANSSDFSYSGSKSSLIGYANTLRSGLQLALSHVVVSVLYPAPTRTDLAAGARPFFLQPVTPDGQSPGDPAFQAFLDARRAELAAGLDPDFVARAYVEVLTMRQPPSNAAVGVANANSTTQFVQNYIKNIQQSAYRFSCYEHLRGPGAFDVDGAVARVGGEAQTVLSQP